MNLKEIEDSIIFLTVSGSHAYGTNIVTSDYDYRGICIPKDKTYYFGMGFHNFEQYESISSEVDSTKEDYVIYDLRKAMRLMSECNPNMIDLLYVPQDIVVRNTPSWNSILEHRDKFLSKKARHTYAGYAFAQLKRIKLKENSNRIEVQKYGYNTKNAMHLVRLLHMGIEILEKGEVNVRREDAPLLLSIRNGAWSIDQLKEYANDCKAKMERLYKTSQLPNEPDREFLDKLCQKVIEEFINANH